MTDVNLSAVLHKAGDLRLEDRPISEPGPGEVQISVQSVGICGSDVHFYAHGAVGKNVVKAPVILGHESAGVVSKLGPGVTSLNVGDRVALEPGIPCRTCSSCKTGRYNLCRGMVFLAAPPIHGDLARYHVHAADFCFRLPDRVSFDEGAMLEPLAIAVHACRRAGVSLGHSVLVCGAGPIGLVNLLTAKACGAASVCVTDISESRLKIASQLGADHVVLVDSRDSQVVAEKVKAAMGDGVNVSIECSGVEASVNTAVYATKAGGTVVIVGMGPTKIEFQIDAACRQELDIKGIWRYANCYPTALAMVASGQIDVKTLITHRFALEDSVEAFETAKTGAGGAIKVIIDCSRKG